LSNYSNNREDKKNKKQRLLFLTKSKERKLKNQTITFVKDFFNLHTGLLFIVIFLGNLQASYGRYPFLFNDSTKIFSSSSDWRQFLVGQKQKYEVFDKYIIGTVENIESENVRFKIVLPPSMSQADILQVIFNLKKTQITKKPLYGQLIEKNQQEGPTNLKQEKVNSFKDFNNLNNLFEEPGSIFFYNESEYVFRNFFFEWTSFLFLYVALFPFWLAFTIIGKLEEKKKSSKLTRALIKKPAQNNKRLKDLAGIEKIQPNLKELIQSLKASQWGFLPFITQRPIPKGFLLVGPPGTGKTLLAQAIAGTAQVTLFATVASEFLDSQKGVGCARLRDLFNKARKSSPAIIFIDEIDTLGKAREGTIHSLNKGNSNEEKIQIFTEFLVQLDGFSKNEKVVIIGATNFSDSLDPAFIRPGRFDRLFQLDHPNQKARIAILKLHIEKSNKKHRQSIINWGRVSQLTTGFTGADLSAMVNESLLYSIRTKNKTIHDTNSLEHGFYRIATYSKPKKVMNSWLKNQQELLAETQNAYYQASKQLFAIYFKKSFQKNLTLPVFFIEDRPKNPRYLTLENEVKKTEIKLLPKKLVKLELINSLIGVATEFMLLERLNLNSNRISDKYFWLSEQGEADLYEGSRLVSQMINEYALIDDSLFFEDIQTKHENFINKPNPNWKEFWLIFQNNFDTALREENDKPIQLNWRFFKSWAWLETSSIYTQRKNVHWGESILDEKKQENKESISPDLFYQTQSLEVTNLHLQSRYDSLVQAYLKQAFYEATCILKKDEDYLDFIAYKYLLKREISQ
jgi:ATP-dependent Zn protease